MEGSQFEVEPGIVAWYKREDAPMWPVVVMSRRGSYWRCRYLGDHQAKSESLLAQSELLYDFVNNIKFVASPNEILRARLATACATAINFIDQRGTIQQRKSINVPAFRTLVEILTNDAAKVGATSNQPSRDVVMSSNDDNESSAAIKSHLEKCESAVFHQRDLVSRRRAEYDAAERCAEQFRSAIRQGEKAVRDAEKQLATAKKRAKSAESKLQSCADDLDTATKELQTRQIAQRAARALLRETGTDATLLNDSGKAIVVENVQSVHPMQHTDTADKSSLDPVPVTTGKRPRRSVKSTTRKQLRYNDNVRHIDEEIIDEGGMEDVPKVKSANNAKSERLLANGGPSSSVVKKSPAKSLTFSNSQPISLQIEPYSKSRSQDKSAFANGNRSAHTWQAPVATNASVNTRHVASSGSVAPTAAAASSKNPAQKHVPKSSKASKAAYIPKRWSVPADLSVVSPLKREGKKLIVTGPLPNDNPHFKALNALGKRMLVRRPVTLTDTFTPRMAFFEDLHLFQLAQGKNRVPEPIMNGIRIDMFRLMGQTLRVGGFEAVLKMRAYTFVCKEAGAMFSNAFFTHKLKNYYNDYVLDYERELVKVMSASQDENETEKTNEIELAAPNSMDVVPSAAEPSAASGSALATSENEPDLNAAAASAAKTASDVVPEEKPEANNSLAAPSMENSVVGSSESPAPTANGTLVDSEPAEPTTTTESPKKIGPQLTPGTSRGEAEVVSERSVDGSRVEQVSSDSLESAPPVEMPSAGSILGSRVRDPLEEKEVEELPVEEASGDSGDSAAMDGVLNQTAVRAAVEQEPEVKVKDNAPVNVVNEAAPADVVTKTAPADVVTKTAPADDANETAPADVVNETAPADVANEAAPTDANKAVTVEQEQDDNVKEDALVDALNEVAADDASTVSVDHIPMLVTGADGTPSVVEPSPGNNGGKLETAAETVAASTGTLLSSGASEALVTSGVAGGDDASI